jgi:hypothetical protein
MSEDKKPKNEAKDKFLEALEKKNNKSGATPGGAGASGSKVGQGEQGPSKPKLFRRKSGG